MRLATSRTTDTTMAVVSLDGRWFDLRPVTETIDGSTVAPSWLQRIAAATGVTRYLDSPARALSHVAGYAISNEVSERDVETDRGEWDKGKNCDRLTPFGPWVVTADEVGDRQDLGLRLWMNGEVEIDGPGRRGETLGQA